MSQIANFDDCDSDAKVLQVMLVLDLISVIGIESGE
jgi:hypothetical protein